MTIRASTLASNRYIVQVLLVRNLDINPLRIKNNSALPRKIKMAKVTVLLCFCILAVLGSVNAHTEKEKVGIYELKRGDMSLKFTNWGATLVSFVLPDKNGSHCY